MGWGNCGTDSRGRPIGYYHAATCDHPDCTKEIDRGLAYACGDMHGFAEYGCEGYFCEGHLYVCWPDGEDGDAVKLCKTCSDALEKEMAEEDEDIIPAARQTKEST